MPTIIEEKLLQAVALLRDTDLDAWLTFARETSQTPDPALDVILGFGLTWDSAFLVTREGRKVAIVGRFDADNVRKLGAYDEVISYDQGISAALVDAVKRAGAHRIGVNYSLSNSGSDGLTHGMFLRLEAMLGPLGCALVSAEDLVRRLRERKSSAELALIRDVTARTERIYAELLALPVRGMSEKEIHATAGAIVERYGCAIAGERINNPIVNAGPDSSIGHGIPSDLRVQDGQILHIDMWLTREGYCSDLQRDAYVLRAGERQPPELVQRAWDACWVALEAGRAALRPGVPAWQVDQAARDALVECGYPEYMHAFGHHVGRRVHDGGSVIGPRWDRYGSMPLKPIEADSVFTLELGVMVEGAGYIGIEEMVLVTPDGNEYLSTPQRQLLLV